MAPRRTPKKNFFGAYFRLTVVPCSGETARLGIFFSSGWKGAVSRNRIKRVVRECFRLRIEKLPKAGYAFWPKEDLRKIKNEELFRDLEKIIHKVSQSCG